MPAILNLARGATLAATLVLAAGTAMAELATIEGEASYRERIALRPGAVLEVELLDISRADVPAERLASLRIKAQAQVPIPFTLHYDPALIEPGRSYAVTAKLIVEGKILFRSDTVHPVLTRGAGDTVEILMVRAADGDAAPPGPATAAGSSADMATLGPTWVAEDIRGRGVIDNLQSHITLTTEGRAHGLGGCNNFTGGYMLDGTTLTPGRSPAPRRPVRPRSWTRRPTFTRRSARPAATGLSVGFCSSWTPRARRLCDSGGASDAAMTARRSELVTTRIGFVYLERKSSGRV